MEDRVTLYIATHNITGKKYFGKTVKWFTEEELQKNYHGSGKYWKLHKKKHGEKDVTMEIYQICSLNESDEDYVVPVALKFSYENNIVESKDWANGKLEDGLDGGATRTGQKASNNEILKRDKTMQTMENGKSKYEIAAAKARETKSKSFLIDGKETTIYKEQSKKVSIYWNTINESGVTNSKAKEAKRLKTVTTPILTMSGITTIQKEAIKKVQISLDVELIIDGELTTSRKEGMKKRSVTMKENILDGDVIKTREELRSEKSVKTRTTEFILNGVTTTIIKEQHKRRVERQNKEKPRYNITLVTGDILENLLPNDVRKLCTGYFRLAEGQLLGHTRSGQLVRANKSHLIGSSIVKVDEY